MHVTRPAAYLPNEMIFGGKRFIVLGAILVYIMLSFVLIYCIADFKKGENNKIKDFTKGGIEYQLDD